MLRLHRTNSNHAFVTAASSMLLLCACVAAVHAGPPDGATYSDFTPTAGTIDSTCSTTGTSCSSSSTGAGFYQRSVVIGGTTYFQTIVLPTSSTVTSSSDISGLAFADENFVQQGGGAYVFSKLPIEPLAPVTPFLFDYSIYLGTEISATILNPDSSIGTAGVKYPEVTDLPKLVSDGFPATAFKAKIIDGASGAVASSDQEFELVPSVSFGLDQVVVEGGTASVKVYLSRPLTQAIDIPYTISGTATPVLDHGAADGTLTIDANSTVGEISFPVYKDTVADDGETVVITLGQPSGDVVLGENTVHTVTISEQDRLISLDIKKIVPNSNGSVVGLTHLFLSPACCTDGSDPMIVKADAKPNFPAGELQYDWSATDPTILSLANISGDTMSINIDRQLLVAGLYTIKAKVSSVDDPTVEASSEIPLKVITDFDYSSLNAEDDSDSDGKIDPVDGLFIDSNENGIDNNFDAFDVDNILQMHSQPVNQGITKLDETLDDGTQVSYEWDGFIDTSIADVRQAITSDIGTKLRLGKTAFALGINGAVVPIDKFKEAAASVFPEQANLLAIDKLLGDSVVDVEVAQLNIPGQSTHVVLPREHPATSDSIIWVFNPDRGWGKFQSDERNQIASATGYKVEDKLFSCPGGRSDAFTPGLSAECVRMTVEDGGPNDADGTKNGVVSLLIGDGPDIPDVVSAEASTGTEATNVSQTAEDTAVSTPVDQGNGSDTSGGGALDVFELLFMALAARKRRPGSGAKS